MPGLLSAFGKRFLPLLLCLFFAPSHVHAQPATKIADLFRGQAYDKATVVVEGEVSSINYAPEIRDGMSLLSFVLDDGTGRVKVLNQTAGMLSRGDRVRVVGVFASSRQIAGIMKPANEIDSTRGEIEVLKGKRAEEIRESRESGVNAVPTTLVDTPWSISIDIATLLSALFAAIATIPLILHSRRFNLAMVIIAPSPGVVRRTGGDSVAVFLPVLRLISTGGMTPQLSGGAMLKLGASTFYPRSLRIQERAENVTFPVAVKDELTMELEYEVPDSLCDKIPEGYLIMFRDAFSRKRFTAKIHSGITESVVDRPRAQPAHHLNQAVGTQERTQQSIAELPESSVITIAKAADDVNAVEGADAGANKDGRLAHGLVRKRRGKAQNPTPAAGGKSRR